MWFCIIRCRKTFKTRNFHFIPFPWTQPDLLCFHIFESVIQHLQFLFLICILSEGKITVLPFWQEEEGAVTLEWVIYPFFSNQTDCNLTPLVVFMAWNQVIERRWILFNISVRLSMLQHNTNFIYGRVRSYLQPGTRPMAQGPPTKIT